jgi:transposase InsO family protein
MSILPETARLYVLQRIAEKQLRHIQDTTMAPNVDDDNHLNLSNIYQLMNTRTTLTPTLNLKESYQRAVPAPRIAAIVLPRVKEVSKRREGFKLNIMLDTGSTIDWVSTRLAPQFLAAGYEVLTDPNPMKVLGGDDNEFIASGQYVNVPITVLADTLPGVPNRQFSFVKRFYFLKLEHEDAILSIQTEEEIGILDHIATIYRANRKDLEREVDSSGSQTISPEITADDCIGSGDELDCTLPEEMTFEKNHFLQAHISPDASPALQLRLRQLNEKYDRLFGELPQEGAKMPAFPITTEGVPKQRPPYRQSETVHEECDRQVEKYLEKGIIARCSTSGFRWPPTSPVLAIKHDGTWRFCIDVSPTNNVTVPYDGPLPNANELIDQLAGKKFFASLDLTSGYHQAFIREEDQIKTAFRTRQGVFYFRRCPFGLKNIPAWWSEQMRDIFANEIGRSCCIYLDDICVYGNTEDEFVQNLERIYKIADDHRMRFKPSKCFLAETEFEYLGHIVSSEGKSLSTARKESIANLMEPRNVSDLRTFLGMANYFHTFVKDYARIAAPLNEVTRPTKTGAANFVWGPDQRIAFVALKDAILAAPQLAFPVRDRPLILRTDASLKGVGGHLVQLNDDGTELPVAYVSKAFNATERRWSTYEQEAYGIVYSIMKLRRYLFGRHFVVETDHRNLVWMDKAESPKVIRWRLSLQQFDFDVVHIPGVTNHVADALSRLWPDLTPSREKPVWLRQFHYMKLGSKVDDMVSPPMASNNDDMVSSHTLEQTPAASRTATLQRDLDTTPPQAREWMSQCHNDVVGHHGANATQRLMNRQGYDWPLMRRHIRAFVKSCPTCQKNRRPLDPNEVAMGYLSHDEPFTAVSMDFVGPLPADEHGNCYILVFIDQFTRYVELFSTSDCSAASALQGLLSVFGRYGAPEYVRCDNGPHFTAAVIESFFKATRAQLHFVTPYQHESNGMVERVNLEVMRHLRSLVYDKDVKSTWSLFTPLIQRILNTTPHSATRFTPSQLVFGAMIDPDKGVLTTMPSVMPHGFTHDDYFRTLCATQQNLATAARQFQAATNAANKLIRPQHSEKHHIGDLVLCNRTGTFSSKLAMTDGPFIIREETKPDVYTIEHPANGKIMKAVHASKLSAFHYNRQATNTSADQEDLAERVAVKDDSDVFFVDSIIEHCYATMSRSGVIMPKPLSFSLRPRVDRLRASFFKVRWLGYEDPQYDTWQRYSSLKDNSVLHDWLRQHKELNLFDDN